MTNRSSPKILVSLAHPDDESFGSGGTLAHYAAQGVHTTLICATGGEVGEISDPSLATPANLAQVRQAELRCACEALGIEELIMLGYRDSGMEGTPENKHPHAFMNTPAEEVVARLVGIIRRQRPQIVITFEPEGGYGHPDHITIHRHTVTAFHAAADPTRYPEQGPAWQPNRLFYTVIPRSVFDKIYQYMKEKGLDTSNLDKMRKNYLGFPDEAINVTIDVAPFFEAKWDALTCHRTQFGPDNLFRQLPKQTVKQLMSREHFVQVWPNPDGPLTGLFAGL